MEGIVKYFNNDKGYGFIEYKGEEYFVHYTLLHDDNLLKVGDTVEFNMIKETKSYKIKTAKFKFKNLSKILQSYDTQLMEMKASFKCFDVMNVSDLNKNSIVNRLSIVASIATIATAVLNSNSDVVNNNSNQINISCDDCKIEIINNSQDSKNKMSDLEILDNYLDKREFRNYISNILFKFGYTDFKFDDVRLSDDDKSNDNDLIAFKDGMKYTIQTFLNTDITQNEINETIDDMKHEHVSYGAIITNTEVNPEIKKIASNNGIEIIDRNELKKHI